MSGYTGQIPDTIIRATDWRADAPCKADPDAMFSSTQGGIEYAKGFCSQCPAVERCLQWALETGEDWGVWGGLSAQERHALRRRAARPISIDDYAGTRPERKPVTSLEEAWEMYALPDGEHTLWLGPKTIYLERGRPQVTPNRVSFYVDRGRMPEGETKRTCDVDGCVRPQHLCDRVERAQAIPADDAFRALVAEHTVAIFGGHQEWTGPRRPSVLGREYTPRQVAFIADRGRQPVGTVRTGCSHRQCLLAAHLTDQEERGSCGTRNGYQWHRRRGEDACGPCKQANTAADNRLRRTGTTLELAS